MEHPLSIQVDSIIGFSRINTSKLEQPPKILFSEYIRNIYKETDKHILILNAQKMINLEEIRKIIQGRNDIDLVVESE